MLRKLAADASIRSRENKWELYLRTFPPRRGERILDVGASSLVDIPWENWFLKRYPYPEQVTAVVLSGASTLREAFPGVTVVEADGRDLPFSTGEFDIVHSNAVIEHVGPWPDQQQFISELVRVGRSGFVTTPNRWFPVESHSQLLLLHWLPRPLAWSLQRRLGHPEADAWLLGPTGFTRLVRTAGASPVLLRQRMAGLTATLVVTWGSA
jgi:Methyltransferase domain